jgi:hypothetical protein
LVLKKYYIHHIFAFKSKKARKKRKKLKKADEGLIPPHAFLITMSLASKIQSIGAGRG